MTKCEVIDQTPSDSGSDSDFIEATCHFCTYMYYIRFYIKFLYIKFLLHQVPVTTEIIYRACSAIVSQSQADSFALRACWEFRFVMLTSVRAK